MTVITVLATPHWAGPRGVEHTANVIVPRASFNVTRVSLESRRRGQSFQLVYKGAWLS